MYSFFSIIKMYVDSLVTKILKIKVTKQDETGLKTVNCNRMNIKYIQKVLNTKYMIREKITRKEMEGH